MRVKGSKNASKWGNLIKRNEQVDNTRRSPSVVKKQCCIGVPHEDGSMRLLFHMVATMDADEQSARSRCHPHGMFYVGLGCRSDEDAPKDAPVAFRRRTRNANTTRMLPLRSISPRITRYAYMRSAWNARNWGQSPPKTVKVTTKSRAGRT